MLNISNPEVFAKHIEDVVQNSGMSYMDAILDFCHKREIDPADIAPFISAKMKAALSREGQALHLLKRSTTASLEEL